MTHSFAAVDKSKVFSNHNVFLSTPTVPTPKAAAQFLIPGKSKESETVGKTEKSSSISHGVLLGLANYATDDDDDEDETEDLSSPNSGKNGVLRQSTSEDRHDANANGSSLVQSARTSKNQTNLENERSKACPVESKHSKTHAVVTEFSYDKNRKNESSTGGSAADDTLDRFESPENDRAVMKSPRDNNPVKETKIKPDKNDRHESKKSSGRDFQEEEESGMKRIDEKGDGKHRRHDERHSRRDKTEELSSSKDRRKEEKAHESESKKRSSHVDDKEDKKETERERHHRADAKEESSRKREHAKDKEEDRSRHKHASDSSRHKKRRSSSVTRGRSSKEISAHHDNDTSDDASDDVKRFSIHNFQLFCFWINNGAFVHVLNQKPKYICLHASGSDIQEDAIYRDHRRLPSLLEGTNRKLRSHYFLSSSLCITYYNLIGA